MAQKPYYHDGKKYIEIRVYKRTPDGTRIRQKVKLNKNKHRISNQREADRIEFEIRKTLEDKSNSSLCWKWEQWHCECLKRMRLTLKESTAIDYDGGLKKWLPNEWIKKDIDKISRSGVYDLIFNGLKSMSEDVTSHTQKSVLRKIKRIFQMAIEEGLITLNPAIGIKIKTPPPKQLVLNSTEANTLLKEAKECNHRYYYHWAVALLTGMRNGELYSLQWKDIDFQTDLISITKQWTTKDGIHSTKNNKNRVIPISPNLKAVLLELKRLGPFQEHLRMGFNQQRVNSGVPMKSVETQLNDLVLPRCSEWRCGEQAAVLKGFCKMLGITEVRFHDLRATFITNLLSQGVSQAKTMAIVGHSSISTTNEYLRLAGVDVKVDTTDRLGYEPPKDSQSNIINFLGK